jgi:hypothetical protein
VTDDANTPVFERGDVVFEEDPFKSDEAARPWVILSNHDGRPFHGEQSSRKPSLRSSPNWSSSASGARSLHGARRALPPRVEPERRR